MMMMNFLSDEHLKKSLMEVSWHEYLQEWKHITLEDYIFRGQNKVDCLKSLFERALDYYGIPLDKAPEIEDAMIRDFRRKY